MLVFSQILPIICTFSSLLVFSSGIPIVWNIIKGGKPLFSIYKTFLIGFFSGVWLIYGIMINDKTVLMVNALGMFLNTLYCYALITLTIENNDKNQKTNYLIFCLSLLGILFIYSKTYPIKSKSIIGLFADILTTIFYITPLWDIKKYLKQKNTEGLSVYLSISVFISSFFWTLFGIHIGDLYIIFPSISGVICGSFELYVLYLFSNIKHSPAIVV